MSFLRNLSFSTAYHAVNVGFKVARGAQAAGNETKECGSAFAAGWRAALEENRAPVEPVEPVEPAKPTAKRTRRSK